MPKKYIKPPSIDAYISTRNNTASKSMKQDFLIVGNKSKHIFESLVLWDTGSIPLDMEITSATANFFIAENQPLMCSKEIEAYQILSCWDVKTTCWYNPPLISRAPITTTAISETSLQVSFGITSLLQHWQSAKDANLGLLFNSSDSFHSHNFVSFFSGNSCNSSYWPFIEITYTSPNVIPCICKSDTIEVSTNVITTDNWSYTSPIDLLPYSYAYTITNNGSNSAIVYLQVSADGINWMQQSALNILSPAQTIPLVPDTLARFARLAYSSLTSSHSTALSVITLGRTTL